ncbi:DUF6913 domain-containing protein [Echinicola rosea]|uniref:Uncharacterized protein n=1 Tax=Echinicola rosea TaxID=1807691 RepID=A0ABQ1V6I2_9BACT|nr:hypothetical protein [Echinicola rosea]GGF40532.1 hypothetical protein GCM10011339_31380 [Echinicola rosea]
MKWIKKFFIGLKIKKNNDQKYEKSKKSIEDIKSIHILANSYENLVIAEACVAKNWPPGVDVVGVHYSDKTGNTDGFSVQNFSLLGKPDESLQEFLLQNTDILIVTASALDPFMQLIVQEKSADYKIGFLSEQGGKILDIMLAKDGNDLSPNIENLLKYLKKII